jgi:hypothetical protein
MRLWDGYNYIDKEIRGALSGSVALCWYAAADQQSRLHECQAPLPGLALPSFLGTVLCPAVILTRGQGQNQ